MPSLRAEFPDIYIGAGTDCFFTELNRERTPADLVDFLTFSVNPQVHAFDNASLTETLEAHRYVVESAQNLADGKGIHVSPVTLKMRFNPNATGPQISRMLRRLRLHGLIKKVGKTYKYYLTKLGRRVILMALKLRELHVIPSLAQAEAA